MLSYSLTKNQITDAKLEFESYSTIFLDWKTTEYHFIRFCVEFSYSSNMSLTCMFLNVDISGRRKL